MTTGQILGFTFLGIMLLSFAIAYLWDKLK